jgi:hypothetical protein
LAGPIPLRAGSPRSAKTEKAYIAIFICLATKAVHLELVTSLSPAAFLETLRWFISRRGKPAHIYSDNGSNFSGANRQLIGVGELFQSQQFSMNFFLTHHLRVYSGTSYHLNLRISAVYGNPTLRSLNI